MHQLNDNNSDNNDKDHGAIIPARWDRAVSARPYPAPAMAREGETDDFGALMQYLGVLRKHKWALTTSLVLGALAGLGVSLYITPMYRAKASMEIQKIQEPFGGSVVASDPTLPTQVQLLQSATMRQRALSKVIAQTPVRKPQTHGLLASMRSLLGLTDPAKSTEWITSLQIASANLTLTNSKDSNIIVIESESPNPIAAADFANTLAHEYIDRNQEQRWDFYENTGEWLTRAQHELKTKVEQSEQRLANYAKSKGLLFTSGSENISEDKLKQLQTALLSASADRIAKQSVYESSLSSPTESLPSVLDSGPMSQYQVKIADLRRELAELSTTLTPTHYRTQRVQAQIDELESAREKERTNIISRIRIEYESAVKRESQLRHDFEAQSHVVTNQADDLIQYNILLREVDTNKKLYEITLQQGKEASLSSAMRTSSARIVDAAQEPLAPEKPNLPVNVSLGILSGLVCGAALIVVRSRSDVSIQAPGILEIQLSLRELGVIPAAKTDPGFRALLESRRALAPSTESNQNPETAVPERTEVEDCLELITGSQTPSIIAEAFRTIMTSILFSGENGDRPRVLVITSPSPQEGKSTVASNLGIALAQINQRVLIIDADMRRPRLHSIFNVPNTFGLSDVLSERKPVREYVNESLVRKTHLPDLYVLPAGPARTNLARLLYSPRMKDLMTRFRDTFDIVLIDTPPVLAVPDARMVARAADAVVLVIRAHTTHQEAAFAATRCFADDGRRVLGAILNDWNPRRSDSSQYTFYNGYHSRYLNTEDRS